jgi:hypothetical protein
MLRAISNPIAFPLSRNIGWFDAKPTDRKEHCPDRNSGWRCGPCGSAGRTPNDRGEDTTLPTEILKLPLQVLSQFYNGLPSEIGSPLAPQ